MSFQNAFPVESHRTPLLILQQQVVTAHVKCYLPGVLIGDPEPRVFIGAGHIGTLCLGSTKFLTPRRKAGVQYEPHGTQAMYREPSCREMAGTLPR